jgi:hypothetical protein
MALPVTLSMPSTRRASVPTHLVVDSKFIASFQ